MNDDNYTLWLGNLRVGTIREVFCHQGTWFGDRIDRLVDTTLFEGILERGLPSPQGAKPQHEPKWLGLC